MRGMDSIKDQMSGFEHPLLLLLASKDKLCFPAGGRMFFEGVASEDKTLREFKELEHELLNETKRAHVHDTVVDWLNERMEKEIELAINDSSDSINTLTKRK